MLLVCCLFQKLKVMELAPTPENINCIEQVFDLAFHPTSDILAVGLIDGNINIYKYGLECNEQVIQFQHHKSSCRGLKFSADGQVMYTISSDFSWNAIDGDGRSVAQCQNAHASALNKVEIINETTIATGDDNGIVKLWDVRQSKEVMNFSLHEDFVSGFCYNSEAQVLISVSGDATLCSYDLRNKKNSIRSDDQESELHCVDIIKNGRKIVCGSQDGVLLLFSWGKWGDCTDRYPGHPLTVDCMVKIDESCILTGSSDGLIRAVSLHPNKIIGIIGDHEEFPVEGMRRCREGRYLASFAHDESVRFWDISMFANDEDDDEVKGSEGSDDEEDLMDLDRAEGGDCGDVTLPAGRRNQRNNCTEEEADMDQEEEGGDDDSEGDWEDDEDEEDEEGGGRGGVMPSGDVALDSDSDEDDDGGNAKGAKYKISTPSERFYADL